VDTEVVVKGKGSKVRIVMNGPSVEMAREEWRKWLEKRSGEVMSNS
jgi:hypothetical protein